MSTLSISNLSESTPLLTKVQGFLKQPLINKWNRLSDQCHRWKTALLYRPMFCAIGRHTVIRRPLLLSNPQYITLGSHVSIREGARLEVICAGKARTPHLSIGNNTNVEQNVHIVCHSRISIGSNVSITGHCAIVDVTHPYADVRSGAKIGAHILDQDSFVEIGDGSFLGFGSVILPNVRIGRHVVIGANAVVSQDIPDYCVACGAPARVVKHYDDKTETWVTVRPADER